MSDSRITRDDMFMAMAVAASQRSSCGRLQVGCVITNHDGTRVVGIGYNGNARGLPNECDTDTPGACGCIHAEANALLKSPYDAGQVLTLYTTYSPCLACAKLILNSQVHRVVYATEYRKTDGITLLRKHGVICLTLPSFIELKVQKQIVDEAGTARMTYSAMFSNVSALQITPTVARPIPDDVVPGDFVMP